MRCLLVPDKYKSFSKVTKHTNKTILAIQLYEKAHVASENQAMRKEKEKDSFIQETRVETNQIKQTNSSEGWIV